MQKYSANEVQLEVNNPRSQWLVFADSFHPGWKARVNGKDVPIRVADLAFKAIKLEKGYNQVRFVFKNGLITTDSRVLMGGGLVLCFICPDITIVSCLKAGWFIDLKRRSPNDIGMCLPDFVMDLTDA